MEQGNYISYEESVIKYKPGPKSKKKTFREKNNEDSKKPEPKTNKDFSEIIVNAVAPVLEAASHSYTFV